MVHEWVASSPFFPWNFISLPTRKKTRLNRHSIDSLFFQFPVISQPQSAEFKFKIQSPYLLILSNSSKLTLLRLTVSTHQTATHPEKNPLPTGYQEKSFHSWYWGGLPGVCVLGVCCIVLGTLHSLPSPPPKKKDIQVKSRNWPCMLKQLAQGVVKPMLKRRQVESCPALKPAQGPKKDIETWEKR